MRSNSAAVPFPTLPRATAAPPRRRSNSEVRTREYLTPDEIEALMSGARTLGRHGHRDATLILIAYRHALRVSGFWLCDGNSSTSNLGRYT